MTETNERVRAGMAWIPAGSFLMGSEDFYPESGPSGGWRSKNSGSTSGR
jgi:hypothetical protein